MGAKHRLTAVQLRPLAFAKLILGIDHIVHHAHLPINRKLMYHYLIIGKANVQLGHVVSHLPQKGAGNRSLPVENKLQHYLALLVETHLEHHQPLRLLHRHEVVFYHWH